MRHARVEPVARDRGAQRVDVRGVAQHGPTSVAGPRQVRISASASTSRSWPFVGVIDPDAQQCGPPSVPGASGAGSTPGAATVDPVGVERRAGRDEPAAPPTGWWPRRRSAADQRPPARAPPAPGTPPTRRRAAGAPARPARAGAAAGTTTSGTPQATSPSTSTDGAVRCRRESGAASAVAGGGVRVRPAAGAPRSSCTAQPSPARPLAEPPVVAVAAAGRAGSSMPPGTTTCTGHGVATGRSQLTLVARPGDVRLVQGHGDPARPRAPRRARRRAPRRPAGPRSPWPGTRSRCWSRRRPARRRGCGS